MGFKQNQDFLLSLPSKFWITYHLEKWGWPNGVCAPYAREFRKWQRNFSQNVGSPLRCGDLSKSGLVYSLFIFIFGQLNSSIIRGLIWPGPQRQITNPSLTHLTRHLGSLETWGIPTCSTTSEQGYHYLQHNGLARSSHYSPFNSWSTNAQIGLGAHLSLAATKL
jgi:hypothetical protein